MCYILIMYFISYPYTRANQSTYNILQNICLKLCHTVSVKNKKYRELFLLEAFHIPAKSPPLLPQRISAISELSG